MCCNKCFILVHILYHFYHHNSNQSNSYHWHSTQKKTITFFKSFCFPGEKNNPIYICVCFFLCSIEISLNSQFLLFLCAHVFNWNEDKFLLVKRLYFVVEWSRCHFLPHLMWNLPRNKCNPLCVDINLRRSFCEISQIQVYPKRNEQQYARRTSNFNFLSN